MVGTATTGTTPGSDNDTAVTGDGATASTSSVPAIAWRPLSVVAALLGVVLVATSSGYGYFADELYFLWAGEHLDWSYVDQPPLLPLLARIMDTVVPGSLVALRLPAALMMAAGVLLTGLIARELGGARRAQVLAAGTFAVSPFMAMFGRYLATSTVDVVLTACAFWLVVRWIRVRDDRLLLWLGVVVAVALQAKYLIVFTLVIAAVASLVLGPRDLLRRRNLWLGVGIVAVTVIPAVLWQAANDWPQLRMGQSLSEDNEGAVFLFGGPAGFLIGLALYCGFVGMVMLVVGLRELLRRPELRFIAVSFFVAALTFILLGWSSHLLAVLFPVLWAAGGVAVARVRWRWFTPVAAVAFFMSASGVLYQLPIIPLGVVPDSTRIVAGVTAGWPEVVDSVADVYDSLPADQRENATVVSDRYEMASAMRRFGADHGLPSAHSPHRGAWYFATPPDSATTVIWVGSLPDELRDHFSDFRRAGETDNGLGIDNEWQGLPIWVGTGQQTPWSQLWPELRAV